jgi:hypothetical protein
MNRFKNIITAIVARGLCLLAAGVAITSCSTIFTDMSDCPTGLSLHFRYDYNMSYANALHKKNDCLTVCVYDSDGNIVTTKTESGDVLADEDYRMDIEVPEGSYEIVAYGGLFCERSSFAVQNEATKSLPQNIKDLYVEMNHDNLTSNRQLHNLFHGRKPVKMDGAFAQDTISMVKNTNNIRIVLQQAQGDPLKASDFTFTITDDNTLMNSSNDVVPNGMITYSPWTMGEQTIGVNEDGDTPISVAYAEFSTGRIMSGSGSRLTVARKDDGRVVFTIPLDKYLLLHRSELYSDMPVQEYLDREDEWSIVFFLDSGLRWLNTHIIINDWTVRLNNIGL